MKRIKLPTLLLSGFLFVTMLGCSSSGAVSEKEDKEIRNQSTWTLKDHLRRLPGVRVTGTDPHSRVIIRGESSTANPSSQPLFVVDGQKVGHSFAQANEMLHRGEINSVEVLPPSRSAQYGMEGHYGVILVYTK